MVFVASPRTDTENSRLGRSIEVRILKVAVVVYCERCGDSRTAANLNSKRMIARRLLSGRVDHKMPRPFRMRTGLWLKYGCPTFARFAHLIFIWRPGVLQGSAAPVLRGSLLADDGDVSAKKPSLTQLESPFVSISVWKCLDQVPSRVLWRRGTSVVRRDTARLVQG
jgi:hypothetical protein